ncbi:alpha-(1,3)-fucosyltransferase C-like [Macrobrachium rosenbergii]|uniref:alpha-(1,3)-fucosyltransferase C-like n=1 Tax=Macrobrachium rosenbergii TaxID=79674 RepID=UPI0034D3CBD6
MDASSSCEWFLPLFRSLDGFLLPPPTKLVRFHYTLSEELKAAGCPSWRCTFTHNRTDIETADAVVFSSVEMTLKDAPHYRTPSQRWVWVTLEAPRGVTGVHDLDVIRRENLHHLINWTMTYNRYADVIGSYGHFRSKDKTPLPPRPNLSSSYPGVIRKYLDALEKNITLADVMGRAWREFVNRPRLVSWVASHCPTISKREQYVDELVKYAPVDIYGRCGNLVCLPKNPFHECWNHTMGRLYLFYLAFENDLCDDYISEKLYRALYYKLVPVVWGGNGYESVMVPGSYINARHYHPKDLAKLLLDLQEDPVAYGRYCVENFVLSLENTARRLSGIVTGT